MTAILRRFLIVCLLLSLVVRSIAQFTYNTNNGAITITGYTGSVSNVIIPGSISGYPVTEIAPYAFTPFERNDPSSVVIPDSVTNIGIGAFDSCYHLTNVTMSVNVKRIPTDAFGFSGLRSFIFPAGITDIGSSAFDNCYYLVNVTIPDSVKSIGGYAFTDCGAMTSVSIPDTVTDIGDWSFAGCVSITNLTIGNGITTIPASAFRFCSRLPTVSIPDSVTNLGRGYGFAAFSSCSLLTNITYGAGVGSDVGNLRYSDTTNLASITVSSNNPVLSSLDGVLFDKSQAALIQFPIAKSGSYAIPTTVTSIWRQAFLDCSRLMDVTFNNNIAVSGGSLFEGCNNLTNISVLAGMTSITPFLFYPCTNLATITASQDHPVFSSINGVLFDKAQTTLILYPYNGTSSYTVPSGVRNIGAFAFAYCSILTNLNLPTSLDFIGASAFSDCYGITKFVIPNGVSSINDWAFYNCSNLVSVSVPAGVTNVGAYSFAFCQNLEAVYFHGDVPTADLTAFFYYPPDPFGPFVLPVTVYYLSGAAGWSTTLAGAMTLLWQPTVAYDSGFGVTTNGFGFSVNWAAGQTIVVEASSNLTGSSWMPVQTNVFSTDSIQFNDEDWARFPSRFYRIRLP